MKIDKIQNLIETSDIVSFDIFDTLITRCVLHPADVFSLVDILAKRRLSVDFDFREARTEAEKNLQTGEKKHTYILKDIYGIIKAEHNLSDEETVALMSIELEAEEKVILPRSDVRDLFLKLYNSGKKIILISDMYLSSKQIKKLLQICGYPTDTELFVSNECGGVKSDGALWKTVTSKYKGKTIVHIGDNRVSDYIAVKKAGQKAVLVNNPAESFEACKMFNVLCKYDNGDFGNSLLLGKLSNEILFNNAFSSSYDYDALTGIWTGSVLSCFMRWLIRNRDDSLLLFVTRECYIFQPMYLEYCRVAGIEPQKNVRFYTSRQAASIASITSEADLNDILEMEYDGSLKNFLSSRCGFLTDKSETEEIKIKLPQEKENAKKHITDYINDIIAVSKPRNEAYKNYMLDCCNRYNCNKMTIVDIGYRGTTQFFLSKIRGDKISGKYFLTDTFTYPESIGCKIDYLATLKSGLHPVYDNISFFEGVLQVSYGQLLELNQDKDGEYQMKFNNAVQTASEIINAQKQYLDFSKTDAEWYGYLNEEFDYPLELAEDLWMCIAYYNYLPESFFNNLTLDNEFSGLSGWKYNSKKHCMENGSYSLPFIYYRKRSKEAKKQKLKNVIKTNAPPFLYDFFFHVWIRFIK